MRLAAPDALTRAAVAVVMFSRMESAMFKDINFRYTDAQEERQYAPELIDKAFVDLENILEEIDRPEKYLVIGPKGAGKSALSSKLQINSRSAWDLFVATEELEQFEFNLLEKTGAEKGTSIGGAATVWQMLLALRLLPLFLEDENLKSSSQNLMGFHEALKKYGLVSSESLIKIVQYTSRRGVFSKLKSVFSELSGERIEEEQSKIKDPAAILESIKNVYAGICGANSRYYLVLDGLDHPIRNGKSNASYIADLLNAARALNTFFSSSGIQAKIIVLIRDEILSIVPDPNLAKRTVDNGIRLKWNDYSRNALESNLFTILEKRASLVGINSSATKLWYSWFPEKIHGRDSVAFVLDNTRYLPRDLISFFREMQGIRKNPPFSQSDVLAALGNYSDWFQTELSDAIVGLVEENLRTEMPSILTTLGRDFQFSDFSKILKGYGVATDEEADMVIKELFRTSWVGNVWKTAEGTERFAWQHRKKNAVFTRDKMIRIHSGLWKSLNLV